MAKSKPGFAFPSAESRQLGYFMDPGERQKTLEQWAAEDIAKLLLLCRHYGIPSSPTQFLELALALARDLYPEPRRRGRKSKWTRAIQAMLVVEVERLIKLDDPGHGVAWACRQLVKREPWASFLEKKDSDMTAPDPAEVLRRIYFDFRQDRFANVTRKAFRHHEEVGRLSEWDEFVSDTVRNPR